PVSMRGSVVSIRRARESVFRLEELVAFGTLTDEMAELLTAAVRLRRNLVISGGAGAGKTTMLNVLSRAIPAGQRVVTIEETAELRLDHPHVVALEARPANAEGSGGVDLRTLVRNALRMRADRIIVGEVRGAEAFEMLQAMHVGHDGSLTTIHANSPRDAIRRLESLVLIGGGELAGTSLGELIASTVHLVAQLTRFPNGSRRLTSLAEITFGGGEVRARDLFVYDAARGRFEPTAASGPFMATLAATPGGGSA
ncbi:MAG TPA: ATPase, T2SS/T4P/T4SS family, partial [Thermoanaerobaculia bacterium]